MKSFAPIALLLVPLSPAGSAPPPAPLAGNPGFEQPAHRWRNIDDAQSEAACRDRIEEVRAATGQPKLDRHPPGPGKPELLYAVDHRIDGCAVLMPVADPADLRPLPPPGAPELMPAHPAD